MNRNVKSDCAPAAFIRSRRDVGDIAYFEVPGRILLLQEGGQAVGEKLPRLLLAAVTVVELIAD